MGYLILVLIALNTGQVEPNLIPVEETIVQQEQSEYDRVIKGNEDKAFIYYNESGFAPNNIFLPVRVTNEQSGKVGVCQLHTGYEKDLYEQDKDCESYMESRYGSWSNARDFWEQNNWW